jgi:hypothetical protein
MASHTQRDSTARCGQSVAPMAAFDRIRDAQLLFSLVTTLFLGLTRG